MTISLKGLVVRQGFTDLPVPSYVGLDHETDVVSEVPGPVDPHDGHGFEDGQPQDGHSTAVRVHDVEHESAGVGDARQTIDIVNSKN